MPLTDARQNTLILINCGEARELRGACPLRSWGGPLKGNNGRAGGRFGPVLGVGAIGTEVA